MSCIVKKSGVIITVYLLLIIGTVSNVFQAAEAQAARAQRGSPSITLVNTGEAGELASIWDNIIAFRTINTHILRYYDTKTGKATSTNLAARRLRASVWENFIATSSTDWSTSTIKYYDIISSSIIDTGQIGVIWRFSFRENIIAFHTSEYTANVDLNGDGDISDYIIRYYDIATRLTVNTREDGLVPSTDGRIIAFVAPGYVLRYYDIRKGTSVNTGISICEGGTSIDSGIIAFTIFEGTLGEDRNGDGRLDDCIVSYYDTRRSSLFITKSAASHDTSISGERIAFDEEFEFDGTAAGISFIKYYDIRKQEETNTWMLGVHPSIHKNVIAFHTHEVLIDLNGDGDTDDSVIMYLILGSVR